MFLLFLATKINTSIEKEKQIRHYLFGFFNEKMGRNKKMPTTDMSNPPMVPAANGNQNASFPSPIIKGIKPKMVETTVRKIGRIFEFHALVKARTGNSNGNLFLIALYSFNI